MVKLLKSEIQDKRKIHALRKKLKRTKNGVWLMDVHQ